VARSSPERGRRGPDAGTAGRTRLSLADGAAARFTSFTHDFGFAGVGVLRRVYFEIRLPATDLSAMQLGEGADIGAFAAEEALGRLRLTPYDAYALWMHHNRARIGTNV